MVDLGLISKLTVVARMLRLANCIFYDYGLTLPKDKKEYIAQNCFIINSKKQ